MIFNNLSKYATKIGPQEFIDKWSLEPKFKMRLVQHLLKKDDHEAELAKLDRELESADVPPICRTGYLLVQFGEMNEKHTDEDFRAAILGKPLPSDQDGAKKEKDEDEDDDRDMCGDFRLGRCTRGDRCRFSHGKANDAKHDSGPQLQEEWMNNEVREFAKKFNIDDALKKRLVNALSKRFNTFKEDLSTLRDLLRSARHPPGMLSLKLREMESGTFISRDWTPERSKSPSQRASNRRQLDNTAKRSRSRERDREKDKERDKEKEKDKEKSKDKDRDRKRDRSRSRNRDRKRDRSRSRSRKKKSRSRSRSRRRDREREKKGKDKDKSSDSSSSSD